MFIRSLLHDGLHSIVSRAMLLCPPATTLLSSEVTLLYKSQPCHIANLCLVLERLLAKRPFSQQYRLTHIQKGQHAFSLVGDSCFGKSTISVIYKELAATLLLSPSALLLSVLHPSPTHARGTAAFLPGCKRAGNLHVQSSNTGVGGRFCSS